jgi:RNA polymerase sigma factor CnrH
MELDDSDAALASRAGGADRHAFDQLVMRHKDGLFRLARSYVGNSDDAYDVVQEAFISAWLAIRRYDPAKDFGAWLRTIALNKCRDFARRHTVRRRFLRLFAVEKSMQSGYAQQAGAEQDEREARRLARLDVAIADLPAFYKEPLLLTMVSGLSQQAVAAQLNTTAKAIELRIRRAKKKLGEELNNLAAEDN